MKRLSKSKGKMKGTWSWLCCSTSFVELVDSVKRSTLNLKRQTCDRVGNKCCTCKILQRAARQKPACWAAISSALCPLCVTLWGHARSWIKPDMMHFRSPSGMDPCLYSCMIIFYISALLSIHDSESFGRIDSLQVQSRVTTFIHIHTIPTA